MADSNRQVAPVRKLVAAVLGTLATFIVLFGAGMSSWTIVALGFALLILSIALVVVTSVRSGARAWVTGIGHVHSVSEPPASSTFGRCELQIVIDAPGLPPRSIKVRDPRVPLSKWPDPGATLPIMVAIDDQRHVRILWDEVMTHAEAAASSLPPEFDAYDPRDDGLLIEEDAPPWERPGPEDDYLGPPAGERMPVDLADDLGRVRDEPVVVRHTPGGTIVLEGTLVEPAPATPLPRRSTPGPGPSAATSPGPSAATSPAEGTTAAASAPLDEFDEIDIDIDGPAYSPRPRPRPGPGPTGQDPSGGRPVPYPDAAPTAEPARDEPVIDEPVSDGAAPDAPAVGDPVLDAMADDDTAPDGPVDDDARGDDPILTGLPDSPPGGTSGGTAGDVGPIHGVGITLLFADLDRSVAFYRDMLGFLEIDGGEGNAVLASGATRIVLRAIRDVAPINRRLVHLNLDVEDVEAAHADLKARGVRFTYAPRAVNRGAKLELWAAAFRDPDGHGIALTQWRDRQQDRPDPGA